VSDFWSDFLRTFGPFWEAVVLELCLLTLLIGHLFIGLLLRLLQQARLGADAQSPGPWFGWLLYPYRLLLAVPTMLGVSEILRGYYMRSLLHLDLFYQTSATSWTYRLVGSPSIFALIVYAIMVLPPLLLPWCAVSNDNQLAQVIDQIKRPILAWCFLIFIVCYIVDTTIAGAAPYYPVGVCFVVSRLALAAVAIFLIPWMVWFVRRAVNRIPLKLVVSTVGYSIAFLVCSLYEFWYGAFRCTTPLQILSSIGFLILLLYTTNLIYASIQVFYLQSRKQQSIADEVPKYPPSL